MKKQLLDEKVWINVFRNIKEENEDIEVTWLDEVGGPGEWCLNVDCELLESGFETEKEAQERLNYLEKKFL